MRELKGHSGAVLAVAYSPDGTQLASGGSDQVIYLWDLARAKSTTELGHRNGAVLSLAYSPDGKTLAAGRPWGIDLWTLAERQVRPGPARGIGGSWVMAFSPDGKKLYATGYLDHAITVWDMEAGRVAKELYCGHLGILSMAHAPLAERLIAAGGSAGPGQVVEWDTQTEQRERYQQNSIVLAVAYSPDGQYLAGGLNDGTAVLWPATVLTNGAQLEGHRGPVAAVGFTPDGTRLLSADHRGIVILWSVPSGQRLAAWDWPIGNAAALAIASDGMTVAAAGRKGLVLWDLE